MTGRKEGECALNAKWKTMHRAVIPVKVDESTKAIKTAVHNQQLDGCFEVLGV